MRYPATRRVTKPNTRQHSSRASPNKLHRTSSFPYPSHIANPTPHEIFHLPLGASQGEIKSRYFDLVRLHHPDSFHIRSCQPALSSDIAHARFRAIKGAYDTLSGSSTSFLDPRTQHPFDPYLYELVRRRRRRKADDDPGQSHGHAYHDGGFGAPKAQQREWNQDGWKERMTLSLGVMALILGLFPSLPFTLASLFNPHLRPPPTSPYSNSRSIVPDMYKSHREAATALAQVRREVEEVGVERREAMKRRARDLDAKKGLTKPKDST